MNNYVNDIRIGHDQRKRLHITYSGEAPARHPYNSPTKQATIFFFISKHVAVSSFVKRFLFIMKKTSRA